MLIGYCSESLCAGLCSIPLIVELFWLHVRLTHDVNQGIFGITSQTPSHCPLSFNPNAFVYSLTFYLFSPLSSSSLSFSSLLLLSLFDISFPNICFYSNPTNVISLHMFFVWMTSALTHTHTHSPHTQRCR